MSKLLDGTELGSVVRSQTRAAPLPRVVLSDADTLTISHYLALKQLSITITASEKAAVMIVPLILPRAVCGWRQCTLSNAPVAMWRVFIV